MKNIHWVFCYGLVFVLSTPYDLALGIRCDDPYNYLEDECRAERGALQELKRELRNQCPDLPRTGDGGALFRMARLPCECATQGQRTKFVRAQAQHRIDQGLGIPGWYAAWLRDIVLLSNTCTNTDEIRLDGSNLEYRRRSYNDPHEMDWFIQERTCEYGHDRCSTRYTSMSEYARQLLADRSGQDRPFVRRHRALRKACHSGDGAACHENRIRNRDNIDFLVSLGIELN